MADQLKAEGNKAFAAKDFETAITKFSEAIELDPENHVLYSNRSGAYSSQKNYSEALADAIKCTELKPDFVKGWSRKGGAMHGTGDLMGAVMAYDEALKLDPSNAQAKSGKESAERAIQAEARADGADMGDPSGGLGNMFGPDMYEKLGKNPKTSHLLADNQFMAKLEQLRKNPQGMAQDMMGDPRMMTVLSVLLGIDMSFGAPGGEGARAGAGAGSTEAEEDVPMPDARPTSPPTAQPKAPAPEPEPTPEDEEAQAAKKSKAEGDALKAKGVELYKQRKFDDAIAQYEQAWATHKDISYLTNLGAAKLEKGDFQGCIDACKTAIAEGREMLADFKLIARAFGRIGTAYEKMQDLGNAIDNYQRSLTEHRTPDILAKLRAAEKLKITRDKEAYISPDEAEKARELGNQKFKEADWPAAVDAYTEMTKRAPEDPRGYSNRAACFIKLLSFPSAVQDCDEALKRDPGFIRAYLRKAQAYHAMREYGKCVDVCTEALEHDKGGANTREIEAQQQKALQAQFSAQQGETEEQTMERIQRDPEIVSILQDPVMQSILQQAKGDPAALQEHMKSPVIKTKIQKLIAAGVIRLGR